MKRFAQISITFIVLISLFIPNGLEFAGQQLGGVQEAQAADPVEFAIVTDFGTGSGAAPAANMINGWGVDFIVTAGDNYQGSTDGEVYPTNIGNYYGPGAVANSRTDFITAGNFYPVPGNHDYYAGGNQSDRYSNYFTSFGHLSWVEPYEDPYDAATDTLYYTFTRGPVQFFMLDTGYQDDTTPDATDQQNWLSAQLATSQAPWKIVVFHMPAASGGASHGSDTGIQWDFAGMGADFVISGHNHVYERISWNGITYFTAGAGGGNGRSDWNASNLPSGAVAEDHYAVLNSSGAMRVNATDTTISFEYITTDGTVQDEVTYPEQAMGACTTETFDITADTQIHSGGEATYNYGVTTPLLVDSDDGGDDVSALLRWDLSSIPVNSVIDSAYINLYIENVTVSPGYDMYAMTHSWVEGTGNGTATSNGATWNTYDGTNSWPGGAGADSDRDTTVLANFTPTTNNATYSASLNNDGLAVLQNWVNGTTSNFGFMINEGSTTDGMDFTSKNSTTVANRPTLTITYCEPMDIGDFVWEDDGDGIQENGEPGLAGVTVNLRDSGTDAIVQTTVTTSTGYYGFAGVADGSYVVEFVKPAGYAFTLKDQGSDDALDSDADPSTGRTGTITLTSGSTEITSVDAGLVSLGIGDRVWLDSDKDGIQDAGELGLAGVIVRLYTTSGSLAGSTYTDASGNYLFEGVAAGNYFVEYSLPGGYTYSPKDVGSDNTVDSDVDMATGRTDFFSFGASAARLDLDCGMWQSYVSALSCTTISLEAVADTYLSESETSTNFGNATSLFYRGSSGTRAYHPLIKWDLTGVTIPAGATIDEVSISLNVTDESGSDYSLYAMRRDWQEGTGGTNTSADWYDYDAAGNDWGQSGARSTTSDRHDTNLWDVNVFDATGSRTSILNSNGLSVVQGWLSNPSTNYGVTIQGYGNSGGGGAFDSRENATNPGPTLNITYCQQTTTGFDIGDEVWKDSDEDGLQDAIGTTEFPGGGVTVRLWQVGGGVVQTTKSTFDNSYGFSDIDPGDYYIEFVLPAGYEYTTEYAGGATAPTGAANDSDANVTSGFTDQFTYDGSTQISSIDAGFKGGYACYAIADGQAYNSDDNDSLIQIDLLTAKGTLIGTSTVGGIEAGAKDPGTTNIYTFNTATWGYMSTLDGAWTTVGTSLVGDTCVDQNGTIRTVGTDGFDGVAYNPVDETWWAAMRLTGTTLDVLVKINKTTGELDLNNTYFPGTATCVSMAAPAGNSDLTDIDDMAFDNTGTLYLLMNNGESEGRVVVPTLNTSGEYTGAGTDLGTIWRADLNEEVTDIEGFSIDENGRVWVTTGGWNVEDNIDHDTLFEILNLSGGGTLIAVPHIQLSIANSLIGGAPGINYTDIEAVTCYGTSTTPGDVRSSLGNFVWEDSNGDGLQDSGEPGIGGVVVELWGRGGDGLFGTADDNKLNEKTTDVDGLYVFTNLPAGQYQVRLASSNFETGGALAGWSQTLNPVLQGQDGGNQTLPYTVSLPWNTDNLTADFGYFTADWGDLPATYGTLLNDNGPRHFGSSSSLMLGSVWDYESNGQPSIAADGDGSDEDGVSITSGSNWNGSFNVIVSGDGCLNAWLDFAGDETSISSFAQDGNFTLVDGVTYDYIIYMPETEDEKTYSEHVIVNEPVSASTTSLSIDLIPAGLPAGSYYARFRLTPRDAGGTCTTVVKPTGFVLGGEVEDYRFDLSVPTGIVLGSFVANSLPGGVMLTWETFSENNTAGFMLYRASSQDGERVPLNNGDMILTLNPPGSTSGAVYSFFDPDVLPGETYYYWLQEYSLDPFMVNEEKAVSVTCWWNWLFLPLITK